MQIQELKLLNFRNYDKLSISFHKHLNIIYGLNGSGKTNLVEAIYVLALTRSFKNINDKLLIKNNTDLTRIDGIVQDDYEKSYKVIITKDGKKVKINNNKITKISDYISKINIVLFHPNDLKMIKDTPSIRRKYLNIAVSQLNVSYLRKLNDYNKTLKIRNAYLKKMQVNGNSLMTYLNVLTEKLIDLGLEIYEIRNEYIFFINSYINSIYKKIALNNDLKITYNSDFKEKSKNDLIEIYQKTLKKDLMFGKTSIGVHHDDYVFLLDQLDLRDYGSEGQQKNAVIAWKFSEIMIFQEKKEIVPILILDDLLSELDLEKIKNIIAFIPDHVQTFVTTTEIEKLLFLLGKMSCKKFKVFNGQVEEVI